MFESAIQKDGFAIIPGVLSDREADQLVDEVSVADVRRSRAGIRHALGVAPFAELARHPDVLELARSVLGPTAIPFHATLFEKSAKSNWLVVWHQDTALPLRERREVAGWGPGP